MGFKSTILLVILVVLVAVQTRQTSTNLATENSPVFVFERGGLYGYTNALGKVVIEPTFWSAEGFSEDLARVWMCTDEGLRWGFIDQTGKLVIPATFDDAEDFSEGLAAVNLDGPWGFIDKTGTVVIQPKYSTDDLTNLKFSEGFAAVKVGDHWGYINRSGELIAKARFDNAEAFSEGLAEIEIKKKHGYIDTTGKIVIKPSFDLAAEFTEGLAPVNVGYRSGSNKPGNQQRDGVWGYIDKSGAFVIEPRYYWTGSFSAGLAVVSTDNGVGYIDKSGRVVIETKYERGEHFSEGLAAVRLNGKWGYIDETGRTVIPFEFDESRGFTDGIAPVNNWHNRINRSGEIIWTEPPINPENQPARICEPKNKPPEPTLEEIAARRKQIHKLMLKGEYQHDGAGELMDIGDITSMPALLRVLKDNPPTVMSDGRKLYICTYAHANVALQKITGYKADGYDDWLKWWEDYRKTHRVK